MTVRPRHRKAGDRLVPLRQQIFSPNPKAEPIGRTERASHVPQYEIFRSIVARVTELYFGIKICNVLNARRNIPPPLRERRPGIELVFGRSQHGPLHVQIAVVGIQRPRPRNKAGSLELDARIPDPPGIDVHGTSADRHPHDQVLAVDKKDVDSVRETSSERLLGERKLVAPQPLGLQVGIGRRKHIQLADGGITKSFGCRKLEQRATRQDERQSGLRHPLRTYVRMMIEAQPGIESQPAGQALAKIDIPRRFMLYLVRLHLAPAAPDRLIPRLAAETEIVHTHRQAISLEQPDALIPRQAQHVVARTEAIVQRPFVRDDTRR